jgi:hypothetical protein
MKLCNLCGVDTDVWGRLHICWPRLPEGSTALSPNAAPTRLSPNSGASRNARWREKHRGQYNAGMKDLMRRKRTKAKKPGRKAVRKATRAQRS